MRIEPDVAKQHFASAAELCLESGVEVLDLISFFKEYVEEREGRNNAVLLFAGMDPNRRRVLPSGNTEMTRKQSAFERHGCTCGHPGLGCMCR